MDMSRLAFVTCECVRAKVLDAESMGCVSRFMPSIDHIDAHSKSMDACLFLVGVLLCKYGCMSLSYGCFTNRHLDDR